MTVLRRLLGVVVMGAGVIGLLLGLGGLVALFAVRPALVSGAATTVNALTSSVEISQKTLEITGGALDATVSSVDSLSEMLDATAATVADTQPVITQVNALMGKSLPDAIKAAGDSLNAAKEAAQSLEGAIKSFETFRNLLAAVPFLGVKQQAQAYDPEKPLADSLGDLSTSIEDMPDDFIKMSESMNKADSNLVAVQTNLEEMAGNVAVISERLVEYQAVIDDSKASMEKLHDILVGVRDNLGTILAAATAVMVLFMLWLLVTQVVIFSQGWELFHGTAGRMSQPAADAPRVDANAEDVETSGQK